jgi:hypothetical protein
MYFYNPFPFISRTVCLSSQMKCVMYSFRISVPRASLNNLHAQNGPYNRHVAGHVAPTEDSRSAYRILLGRPEGKRRLGRPRRGWEDSIKTDIQDV